MCCTKAFFAIPICYFALPINFSCLWTMLSCLYIFVIVCSMTQLHSSVFFLSINISQFPRFWMNFRRALTVLFSVTLNRFCEFEEQEWTVIYKGNGNRIGRTKILFCRYILNRKRCIISSVKISDQKSWPCLYIWSLNFYFKGSMYTFLLWKLFQNYLCLHEGKLIFPSRPLFSFLFLLFSINV